MSTQQIDRLQSLLTRVQENRSQPRAAGSGASNGQQAKAHAASMPEPELHVQQGFDTAPPPAMTAMPMAAPPMAAMPMAAPPMAAPAPVMRGPVRVSNPTPDRGMDRGRGTVEPEQVNLPEHVTNRISRSSFTEPVRGEPTRSAASDARSAPSPARSQQGSPGSTPLEMALEGEVAREVARAAAQGFETGGQAAVEASSGPMVGRVLADPTPPTITRPIVQAVTKHPPTTGHTFGEMLRRSLALRPR